MGSVLCPLLGFPCLRVGAILACGIYGANSLRVCSLGCPSWLVIFLSGLFVLHLIWQWGGLVTDLWPLLLLLCVGLLWGLCCAVLSHWLLHAQTCRVFAWGFLKFRGPSSWCFLGLFTGVISSRFRCHPDSSPSVAWRRGMLPWCSVGGFSPCPSGAVMPLGSSVLKGSWSSRWASCLRSALWSSSVCVHDEDFPSFWGVGFLHFVPGPLPLAGAVFFSMRLSRWLSLLLSGWSCAFALCSSSLDLVCVGTSTVTFSYVFFLDVVTLWVISVFLSLLIANEGLHWWLFLSGIANHFWGRVMVFLCAPLVCRHFLWLVAALLPGLLLRFASGLSSPGLICCLAMSLRYAYWLSLWLCTHSLLGQGFHGLLACPLLSSLLWFCKFLWVLFSHMVHNLRDGVTPVGSRLVCPRSERRFSLFSFPFRLFLHVVTALRDIVAIWFRCVGRFPLMRDRRLSWVLRSFSFWMGFEPLFEALLSALSLQGGFLVVLAEDESLWLSLVLSSVLPCNMFWLHVCLHGTGSGPQVLLGALPLILPVGLEPLSEAPLSALWLLALPFLVFLAEAAGLREFLVLSIVLP